MSRIDLLTRHPQAEGTESLYPYFLRLSELNGYESPSHMLTSSGIDCTLTVENVTCCLSAVANCCADDLDRISYHQNDAPLCTKLLNHPVCHQDLRLLTPRICVKCIEDKKFIEAHFDLGVMILCPVHQCYLPEACSECTGTIAWLRPGLLECGCGAPFTEDGSLCVERCVIELLSLVRAKVLGLAVPQQFDSGLPVEALWQLSLREMLHVIKCIGRRDPVGPIPLSNIEEVVRRAGNMLSNWPNNFFGLLSELTTKTVGETDPRLSRGERAFREFYFGLGRELESQGAAFFRSAFSQFSRDHLGYGSKLARRHSDPTSHTRFVSMKDARKLLGVSQGVLNRAIENKEVATCQSKTGSHEHLLIDTDSFLIPKKDPTKVMSIEQASKELCIPTALLSHLKKTGDFEVRHLTKGSRGIHESDVQRFKEKLRQLTPSDADRWKEADSISFRSAVAESCNSRKIKMEIVRRILSGTLAITTWAGYRIENVMLNKTQYLKFLREYGREEVRARLGLDSIISTDAAALLDCPRRAVTALVSDGHLRAFRRGNAVWIDQGSLSQFMARYSSLRLLAKRNGTSCRVLKLISDRHRIPRLALKYNCSANFIEVDDESKILGIWRAAEKRRNSRF
jgi:hypothetical protein